ncbi:MAG TPA: sulfite exporter TauE/SafE family protein [Gemmatimonadales bacterium]
MTALELSGLILVGAFLAGLLGSLTGLGGGMVIVPLLTIAFGVDLHYAIGASLISVIATSSGAAAAYVKEGYTNIRLGMLLEIATTTGALGGAFIAGLISTNAIAYVFAAMLVFSAYLSARPRLEHLSVERSDVWARPLRLTSTYPTSAGLEDYGVTRVPLGFGLMFIAGILSGLLGIGSGALKVLAMDNAMRLPFKVSTTTSNFMIGVTAAASAGVYLRRGYIDPALSFPVMLGVLAGALLGARLLSRIHTRRLRQIFAFVILALAAEMVYKASSGRI